MEKSDKCYVASPRLAGTTLPPSHVFGAERVVVNTPKVAAQFDKV